MEALERFKKKLEGLAWNEMLYYKNDYLEYKIVYTGYNAYVVRKYLFGKPELHWTLNSERMIERFIGGGWCKPAMVPEELDRFESQIVPIT